MARQQQAIYAAYVKRTTEHNVEPTIIKGDDVWPFLRGAGIEFANPKTYETRFWDGPGRRFNLDDGRVAEYSTTNTAMSTPLLAVFETSDDYFNYRRPLGMFHYLNT